MSFDVAEMEVVVLDSAGRPAPLTLHSHALSEQVETQCREGRLTFFQKPKTDDPKEPLVPLASLPAPAAGGRYIAIVSGGVDAARLNLVADNAGAAAAGTIRFFNLCPKPVALSIPGARRIIPSGQEFSIRPQVKAQQYGQAQFFLTGEDGDWHVAGGLRWLQLEDIHSMLFLVPALGETDVINVRGVEERVAAEVKKPAVVPPTPAGSSDKRRVVRKTLQ
jgi:hypothetical protein